MNPQVEKFIKLPFYKRFLIVFVVLLSITGAFYFFVFVPKMDEYKGLVKKSETLQAEIVQKKSIADNLVRFRDEYDKMQQRLDESLKELPNDKELPELLTSIAAIAKQNQLEVKKFQPGGEVAKGFYAEVPVTLTLTGRYLDIGRFFFDISEMPRIVTVGNIKMKTVGGKAAGQVLISVDCQATTYRFLSAGENPPPAKKK
ncbi:MAG: pilus assembly protein PilO [Deltaproteobacteria bacterium HGW-Deltaproteobacteria-4]|nr:MAG: pilus assembly protein PilO [Deltaproteobacteria bacterium HGW-Deltaproteobacteria-4]